MLNFVWAFHCMCVVYFIVLIAHTHNLVAKDTKSVAMVMSALSVGLCITFKYMYYFVNRNVFAILFM